jgi:transcriptional regulator with XRE-family HTH domain
METLGPDLLERLKHAGLAQKDVARALGVTEAAVSQWAHGVRVVSSEYLGPLIELWQAVRTRIEAGGDWREVVADWKPTGALPPIGEGLRPQEAVLYQEWEAALLRGDRIEASRACLRVTGHVLGNYGRQDPKTMKPEDFKQLRRLIRFQAEALDELESQLTRMHPD